MQLIINNLCYLNLFYIDGNCLLKDIHYNGQIYLEHNGLEPSTGILKMYLDGKYMPICSFYVSFKFRMSSAGLY